MQRLVISVKANFPSRSSRSNGKAAREFVLMALGEHQLVSLDFACEAMTPSFADELVGGLVTDLGREEFERRVVVSGLTDDGIDLIKHLVSRRSRPASRQFDVV